MTMVATIECIKEVRVSRWEAHDTNFFEPLLTRTAQNFNQYGGDQWGQGLSQSPQSAPRHSGRSGALHTVQEQHGAAKIRRQVRLAEMFHFFHYKQQEFWTYYHQRSNVETVFSMIKERFGQSLFSKSRAGQRGDLQGTVPQPRRGQPGAPLWAEPLAGRPAAGCWLRAMHHHQPKGNGMQSRENTERPRSYNRGLQSWQQSTCPPQTNAEGRWCVISGSDEVMGSGDLCAESRAYVQAHFYVQSRCGDKCGKGRGET